MVEDAWADTDGVWVGITGGWNWQGCCTIHLIGETAAEMFEDLKIQWRFVEPGDTY